MGTKIIIPTLNEEDNIEKVVRDFKKLGSIIVCDNSTNQNTAKRAENAGAKVISEKQKGKGYAIRRLLQEKAEIYLLVDGDGAFNAEDAKTLLEMVATSSCDMAIAYRTNIDDHTKGSKFIRKIGRNILKKLFIKRFNIDTDFMCGMRAFNKKVMDELDLKSNGFGIDTEITIQALQKNFIIKNKEVKVNPRIYGKQKANIFNVGFPILKLILKDK